MILLVVFLPIYASDAYAAASLDIVKISGSDGIDGYMRGTDQIEITAVAKISDSEDVTPQKLRVYLDTYSTYTFFQVCDLISGSTSEYNCTYTGNVFGAAGSHTYSARLFAAANMNLAGANPLVTDSVSLTVDDVGARVTLFEAVPSRTRGGDIQINYGAEDYAQSDDDNSVCAGVDYIEFYSGGYSGTLEHVETTYNLCDLTDNFDLDAGTTEGDFTLCARAYDLLGQTIFEPNCIDYHVDRTGPQADLGSLLIVDNSDPSLSIDYIGGNTEEIADISISIDAEDLVEGTVVADFSNLGGGSAEAPDRIESDDVSLYTLFWDGVVISPDLSACAFDIYAEDELENSATTTVPCGIGVDNQGPQIQMILTDYPNPADSLYYLGNVTNITAFVSEPGIGLENFDIYLHLDAIGLGRRVAADNCTGYAGAIWICEWYNIEPPVGVSDGVYTLQISGESKDDLGNIMGSAYDQQIGLDRTTPLVNPDVGVNIIPGINNAPTGPEIILTGDRLQFTIYTTDAYSASADFSLLGGSNDTLPISCDMSADPSFCVFETTVADSGPYDADISFNFMDSSGNVQVVTESIPVAGFYNESSPDFWSSSSDCSPVVIDREVASLSEQPLYCYISLDSGPHTQAEILTFDLTNSFDVACNVTNPEGGILTDYISDIQVSNNVPGSTDPYLFVKLQTGDFLVDRLNFTCEFEIYTKEGTNYTLNPEYEQVRVNLGFYDLPVGELGANYDASIDEVEDSIDWLDGWFDELFAVTEYATKTCESYAALSAAMTGLTALGVMFGISTKALKGTPYEETLKNLWKKTCKADDKSKKKATKAKKNWFDQFCAYVNCKYADDILNNAKGEVGNLPGVAEDPVVQGAMDNGFDVKESIIWSLGTLCLPGIMSNLNKWKEIQCQYLVCMKSQVPTGVPTAMCEDIKGFMECKFWVGELFNALPFMQIWSNMMTQLTTTFGDPLATIGWIVDQTQHCGETCKAQDPTNNLACAWFSLLSQIGDAVTEVSMVIEEEYWEVGTPYCDQLETVNDALEE